MNARFPSVCVVCAGDIERGDEVDFHPTLRGPKGGKKVAHINCLGGAHSNPGHIAGRDCVICGAYSVAADHSGNPICENHAEEMGIIAASNAGHRKKRGRQFPAPSMGHPGPADWRTEATSKLVEMAQKGDEGAKAELARRGRDLDGVKLAWKQAKANPFLAANPFLSGNPFSVRNAGRRTQGVLRGESVRKLDKKGKPRLPRLPDPDPRFGHPGGSDWLGFTKDELASMAAGGDKGAVAELARRGRDKFGNAPEGSARAKIAASAAKRR
jgi:hypothetical protein